MAIYLMFGALTQEAMKAVSAKRTEDALALISVGLGRLLGIRFRTAPAVSIDEFDRLAAA